MFPCSNIGLEHFHKIIRSLTLAGLILVVGRTWLCSSASVGFHSRSKVFMKQSMVSQRIFQHLTYQSTMKSHASPDDDLFTDHVESSTGLVHTRLGKDAIRACLRFGASFGSCGLNLRPDHSQAFKSCSLSRSAKKARPQDRGRRESQPWKALSL